MKTIDLRCSCKRQRGRVPLKEIQPVEKHVCPLAVLVGCSPDATSAWCTCCESCTTLCLPIRIVQKKADLIKAGFSNLVTAFERLSLHDE